VGGPDVVRTTRDFVCLEKRQAYFPALHTVNGIFTILKSFRALKARSPVARLLTFDFCLSAFRLWDLGFGLGIWDLGFGIWDLGFGI
jgi:hypothetical protein